MARISYELCYSPDELSRHLAVDIFASSKSLRFPIPIRVVIIIFVDFDDVFTLSFGRQLHFIRCNDFVSAAPTRPIQMFLAVFVDVCLIATLSRLTTEAIWTALRIVACIFDKLFVVRLSWSTMKVHRRSELPHISPGNQYKAVRLLQIPAIAISWKDSMDLRHNSRDQQVRIADLLLWIVRVKPPTHREVHYNTRLEVVRVNPHSLKCWM
mmetsp:Transcript_35828/g.85399  ORF Transcript_35828/g.85399 Transcript_35828/m.85399 type:complete len:211 (+) Transcript_35828:543-1175(+)